MSLRLFLAALVSAFALLGTASAVPATAASTGPAVAARHACTQTSTHHCIRGGEFCPRASYHHSGWDAAGRRYVCKGNRSHPHWMKP